MGMTADEVADFLRGEFTALHKRMNTLEERLDYLTVNEKPGALQRGAPR